MVRIFVLLMAFALPAAAESLVATRVIRAQTLLSPDDVTVVVDKIPGALTNVAEAMGLEARVTLYPGRAVRAADLGPPGLVERNQIVTLTYSVNGLGITTEGRALERGGLGDVIRVMNLSSRATLTAQVAEDGSLRVGSMP
jgi:flagellar basal body P-ring formation protein FlgA